MSRKLFILFLLLFAAATSRFALMEQPFRKPHRFDLAFRGGVEVSGDGGKGICMIKSLGLLDLASGGITACDPFNGDCGPFNRHVPAGRYPVDVCVALFPEEERVAFSRVLFSMQRVKQWVPADIETGDSAATVLYAVDSGTGCFSDRAGFLLFRDRMEMDPSFADSVQILLEENNRVAWSWANLGSGGFGIVLFSSGWGRGEFASYWGLDAQGRPAALVTDFKVAGL